MIAEEAVMKVSLWVKPIYTVHGSLPAPAQKSDWHREIIRNDE